MAKKKKISSSNAKSKRKIPIRGSKKNSLLLDRLKKNTLSIPVSTTRSIDRKKNFLTPKSKRKFNSLSIFLGIYKDWPRYTIILISIIIIILITLLIIYIFKNEDDASSNAGGRTSSKNSSRPPNQIKNKSSSNNQINDNNDNSSSNNQPVKPPVVKIYDGGTISNTKDSVGLEYIKKLLFKSS